ncbi:MAG TPA: hypothetical protein VIQ11_00070 [Mycobacterium sp.]
MDPEGNIVVVENDGWQRYHWHWADRRILDMLIGGPGLARRYLATFRLYTEGEWTGVYPAYSGAVIDFDRSRLLFFGDDLMAELPHRRAMLEVLPAVWAGFEVGWAYGGMPEIAGYVGVDLVPAVRDRAAPLALARGRHWPCQLVSVVAGDGSPRIWPLTPYSNPASRGPALVDSLPGRGSRKVVLRAFPSGGVHVDIPRKALGVWTTGESTAAFVGLPQLWRGWTVVNWGDRYEEQVARCEQALRVPAFDIDAAIKDARDLICERLFHCRWDGPAAEALSLAEALSQAAPGFPVSKREVLDGLTRADDDEWAHFVQACDRLRSTSARSA